jgi:hypothetical protein
MDAIFCAREASSFADAKLFERHRLGNRRFQRVRRRAGGVRYRTAATKKPDLWFPLVMADPDPELARLLYAQHLALLRTERLRGYPSEDQVPALAQLVKAQKTVRKYRARHP